MTALLHFLPGLHRNAAPEKALSKQPRSGLCRRCVTRFCAKACMGRVVLTKPLFGREGEMKLTRVSTCLRVRYAGCWHRAARLCLCRALQLRFHASELCQQQSRVLCKGPKLFGHPHGFHRLRCFPASERLLDRHDVPVRGTQISSAPRQAEYYTLFKNFHTVDSIFRLLYSGLQRRAAWIQVCTILW